MNPQWNKPWNDEILMQCFLKAVELVGQELIAEVEMLAFSWIPARDIVEDAMNKRLQVHPSGKIVLLSRYCPWSSHL